MDSSVVRVAAVADLHFPRTPLAVLQPLFAQMTERADVVAICGDLTDRGQPEEARALAREISMYIKVPVVAVLGNHDYESGKPAELKTILADAGVQILDGDSFDVRGVAFAGVKGFAGGFGPRALQPWGEEMIKRFVHEAVEEALRLESALARSRAPHRVVLLHYAPIFATVQGEALEIMPFLGSSRLEEPLTHYPVDAVFHGHAHNGSLEGRTRSNLPVYNVSLPLLQRLLPDRPPFRVIEVRAGEPVSAPAGPGGSTDHAGEPNHDNLRQAAGGIT